MQRFLFGEFYWKKSNSRKSLYKELQYNGVSILSKWVKKWEAMAAPRTGRLGGTRHPTSQHLAQKSLKKNDIELVGYEIRLEKLRQNSPLFPQISQSWRRHSPEDGFSKHMSSFLKNKVICLFHKIISYFWTHRIIQNEQRVHNAMVGSTETCGEIYSSSCKSLCLNQTWIPCLIGLFLAISMRIL